MVSSVPVPKLTIKIFKKTIQKERSNDIIAPKTNKYGGKIENGKYCITR